MWREQCPKSLQRCCSAYWPGQCSRKRRRIRRNEPSPLFRVTVVGRTTAAINYRPRSGDTRVEFSGTPLLPEARGHADVSGEKGYIRIDAHFDKTLGIGYNLARTNIHSCDF